MSANPRSPESGESFDPMPDWVLRRVQQARAGSRRRPGTAAAIEWLADRIFALENSLSSARERADRAEQERDRWRAWAEHQEWCRPCSEDPEEYRDHECRELKRLAHESDTPTPTPDHA